MNRIKKGETKLITFTLKENSVLPDPHYIFNFESKSGDVDILFTQEDISNNKDRYNLFTFSEGVTATFSGGFIGDVANYNYIIYETPIENSIDISTASVVEVGIFEITGTTSNWIDYDDNNINDFSYSPS